MTQENYEQFNIELKELMDKHNVAELRITQQITIVPKEMPKEQTQTGEQVTDEEEGQKPAK